jgi:predicted ATP-grasp superfamily ATP-dependent carboligase
MTHESYTELVIREFKRLKSLADAAIVQCSDAQFFAGPAPSDNSVAVIVKHVAGNLISRWTDFLTSDGEKPNRNRDAEFEITPEDSRARLLEVWERGWSVLFASLSSLAESDLQRTVKIRGESLSALQAINRQLTHYSYHVGQIVYVAKHFCGDSWKTLSIPRKGSAQFNQKPAAYVPKA